MKTEIAEDEKVEPWLPSCFPYWYEWQCADGACEVCQSNIGDYEPGTEEQLPPEGCTCKGGCRSRYVDVPHPVDFKKVVFRESAAECLPGDAVLAKNAPEIHFDTESDYPEYLGTYAPLQGVRWIFQDWNRTIENYQFPEPEDVDGWDPNSQYEHFWIRRK